MALWRDPLAELIGGLEQALPTARASPADLGMPPPIEDFQLIVHAVLSGTPEERARSERDPRVQAVWAYLKGLGRALQNGA
jgi:hypothetical protein